MTVVAWPRRRGVGVDVGVTWEGLTRVENGKQLGGV